MKTALIESKKLLEHIIEFIDEPKTDDEFNSIEHYLKALKIGCECDDYNGFDCGCTNRAFLCDEALKELKERKANEA